jgi:hypothetical protein
LRKAKKEVNNGGYEKFLIFESKWPSFNLSIAEYSQKQILFLASFLSEKKDLQYADNMGKKLEKMNHQINNNYRELSDLLPRHPQLSMLYAVFRKYLRNEEEIGNEIIANTLKNKIDPYRNFIWNFDPFFARNIREFGIVEVSCEKDTFSKITAVSAQFHTIFGLQDTGKIDYDIKVLLPDCISKKHDEFLRRYIETNHALNVNSMNLLFAKNHSGFIFPCKVFVKPSPILDQG